MSGYDIEQLGNYRVIRLLEQGGYADVYLGEHIYLQTQAAIKILRTRLLQDDLEVFLREARIISNLIHPHIVRVLEFGVQDSIPFLVMDYAPNGTLRKRHPKGTRLAPATIVTYVKQVASALRYAHDKRLIHRDVKPENMLLGLHNEILLSDFGVAVVSQSSRYQSTQEVVGTLAYMAPEQFYGRPGIASDQYALGIVVYEWLTGDRPFHGSFAEMASQHAFMPPPLLHDKRPEIAPAIEEVMNKALAKDPQQRFLNIEAFADALEQACKSANPLFPSGVKSLVPPFIGIPPTQGSFPDLMAKQVAQPAPLLYPRYQQAQFPQQPFGMNLPSWSSSSNYGAMPESIFVGPQSQRRSSDYSSTTLSQPQQGNIFSPPVPDKPKQPGRGPSRRSILVAIAGVTGLVAVGSAATLFALSQKQQGFSSGTGTSTKTPPPGTVLYAVDWSSGLNGWVGSPDWNVLNGELLNNGTDFKNAPQPTILAPYTVIGTADYAVEVTIRVLRGGPCFDVAAVRGASTADGWHGYKGGICGGKIMIQADNEVLIQKTFDAGNTWHDYRLEVKGNTLRFYVDGGLSLETNDNRYLSGGQTGLKSYNTQLEISSFKIIAL